MFLRLLALAALCTAPVPANAHALFEGALGFYGGFLHPLLTPTHALAIGAFGLLAARGSRKWVWPVTVSFMVALVLGFSLIPFFNGTSLSQVIILVGAAISAIGVALNLAPPTAISVFLALAAGLPIGAESAPQSTSLNEAIVAILGTLGGVAIMLVLIVEVAMSCHDGSPRLAVRVIGSWIAASAVLVLALAY